MRNRFIPIVTVVPLFGTAMICYDVIWVRPVYGMDSEVIVGVKSGSTSTTQIEAVKSLVESRTISAEVRQNLKLRSNVEDLGKKISVSDENSRIAGVNIEDIVIQRTRDIADELADITMKSDADEYAVKVLECSSAPPQAVPLNLVMDTLLAYAVGFFIPLIASMVRESHDDTIRVNTNAEDSGVSITGDIPYIDERDTMIDEG